METIKSVRGLVELRCIRVTGEVKKSWFGFKKTQLPVTAPQRHGAIESYLEKINSPIKELCQDILDGNYDTDIVDKDKYKVVVGGMEFQVSKQFHMSATTDIKPCITLNKEEHRLFVAALQEMEHRELVLLPREEVLDFYKEVSDV